MTKGFSLLHITTVPMSLVFFQGQVAYMKDRGVRIQALSSPGPELYEFSEKEGVPVHAVSMPRRITPLADLVAVWRIRRVIRQSRPDIVHAHTPKGGLLGMIAAWLAGTEHRIYHMRGLPLMGASGLKRLILRTTEWTACRLAHRVLCVSHSVRREAIAAGLCPPEKIAVLLGGSGNGVDSTDRYNPELLPAETRADVRSRLGIPEDAIVVGFVGRIVRDKGITELVDAWRELRVRWPDLHLLVVGPFEPQDPVPARVETILREDDRVYLTGLDWNTPALYAAMDVVALPTYREGFPNVPLEAAAMRLPVVATRIPGCVDAVEDGVTGTLVEARDASALRGALERYIADPVLRQRHGRAARERVVRDFRQEAIWEALFGEYVQMLGGEVVGGVEVGVGRTGDYSASLRVSRS